MPGSRPSSKSPKTRKSPKSPKNILAKELANDPIYQAMVKGNVKWGNIVENKPKFWAENVTRNNKRNHKPHAVLPRLNAERLSVRNGNNNWELSEILKDYNVPDLQLRKGIWENFPVVLVPLNDANGVDRYGVSWHNKNLKDWRNTKPESWDEWMNYQHWCEVRLLHSLRKHSKQYKLLPARNPSQLFVIEMVFRK